MPNTKQSEKRMRQNEEIRQANKRTRSAMRSAIKQVMQADSAETAEKALPFAVKKVDKASKANIIHNNAAAHKKSQLAKAVNKLKSQD